MEQKNLESVNNGMRTLSLKGDGGGDKDVQGALLTKLKHIVSSELSPTHIKRFDVAITKHFKAAIVNSVRLEKLVTRHDSVAHKLATLSVVELKLLIAKLHSITNLYLSGLGQQQNYMITALQLKTAPLLIQSIKRQKFEPQHVLGALQWLHRRSVAFVQPKSI